MIRFFKGLLFNDLRLKLISLALAVALWATVSSLIEKGERERGQRMDSNKQFQGVPVSVVFPAGDATIYDGLGIIVDLITIRHMHQGFGVEGGMLLWRDNCIRY